MSVDLVILRHAPAAERDPSRWPDDARRPLTGAGRRDARRVALGLSSMDIRPRRVLTSPAVRCHDTAAIAASVLSDGRRPPKVEVWPELAFGGAASDLVARLARDGRRASTWLLVGHEPMLGRLVGLLVFGEEMAAVRLRRGGACRIEHSRSPRPGSGRLDWLLTRAQLVRLGGSS